MPGSRKERLSTLLNLSFPYDWSNSDIDESVFILRVLEGCFIEDIVKCTQYFGIQKVFNALHNIEDPLTFKISERQFSNIKIVFNEII